MPLRCHPSPFATALGESGKSWSIPSSPTLLVLLLLLLLPLLLLLLLLLPARRAERGRVVETWWLTRWT